MKILHVVFSYDADLLTEEELLKRHYTVTGCTEALQRKGVEVCVMNRFAKEIRFQKNNVRYFLFKDRLPGHVKAWHFPLKFLINIRRSDADLVHLHNLTLSLQTLLLRLLIKKNTAIIVQHHGGTSPTGIKRLFHRLLNRVADGYFFATTKQGMEWFNGKYPSHKMMPVMEGATFFNYEDRDDAKEIKCFDRSVARRKTGMSGSPVFLWVGRLDPNKDPLTVLAGFEGIFAEYKETR